MAKLTATFLFFFFFAISFSRARDLTARSKDEVSVHDFASGTAEDSNSNSASILLPSEKSSDYEATKSIAELDQVRAESNPSKISATDSNSDPMVVITFRPMNRQIGRRSVPLILRRGRRGCHQYQRHQFKPWNSMNRIGGVSYGNDMLVAEERSSPKSGANWESDREMAIPSRWSEFLLAGPRISDQKEDRKHLHHDRKEDVVEEKEEEQERKEKSGFLTNFRKFLNQFEFWTYK